MTDIDSDSDIEWYFEIGDHVSIQTMGGEYYGDSPRTGVVTGRREWIGRDVYQVDMEDDEDAMWWSGAAITKIET